MSEQSPARSGADAQARDESLSALAGKYLTFLLAGEAYGVNILKVREIIGLQAITRVPDAAPHIKGVINLRGQVIAVIDLRLRFGMPEAEHTEETCIIIVETGKGTSSGIIVDQVDDVVTLANSAIEPPPRYDSQVQSDYIMAMGKAEKRLLILLDTDRVLARNGRNGQAE